MHSIQSLREIRAMEFFLYGGLSKDEFYARPRSLPKPPQNDGEVVAVARYNLATREITIEPKRNSPEGDLAAEKV